MLQVVSKDEKSVLLRPNDERRREVKTVNFLIVRTSHSIAAPTFLCGSNAPIPFTQ